MAFFSPLPAGVLPLRSLRIAALSHRTGHMQLVEPFCCLKVIPHIDEIISHAWKDTWQVIFFGGFHRFKSRRRRLVQLKVVKSSVSFVRRRFKKIFNLTGRFLQEAVSILFLFDWHIFVLQFSRIPFDIF